MGLEQRSEIPPEAADEAREIESQQDDLEIGKPPPEVIEEIKNFFGGLRPEVQKDISQREEKWEKEGRRPRWEEEWAADDAAGAAWYRILIQDVENGDYREAAQKIGKFYEDNYMDPKPLEPEYKRAAREEKGEKLRRMYKSMVPEREIRRNLADTREALEKKRAEYSAYTYTPRESFDRRKNDTLKSELYNLRSRERFLDRMMA